MPIEDYRWISAGELAKNQYVTVLSIKPYKEEVILPTGDKTTITKEEKNPWIKGLPFRVANVKLPIVMLHNICKAPNIPVLVFYDTRQIEFLEVDEEYVLAYQMHMFPEPSPELPTPPATPPNNDVPESAEAENDTDQLHDDAQIYLDFGDEDEEDDDTETGEPPVVLV